MNSRTVRLSGTQTELYTSYAYGYVCARYSNTAKRYSIRDSSGPTYSLYVDSSESTYSLGEDETLFYVSHAEGANIAIPVPLSGGTSFNVTSAYICDASPVSIESSEVIIKGTYLEQVTSTERHAFPDNGEKGGFFYEFIGEVNQAPLISATTTALGTLSEATEIVYNVSDPDGGTITVAESIDDTPRPGSPFVLRSGETRRIPINPKAYTLGEHRLKVTATDPHGAQDTKLFTFSRGNASPTISGEDEDLGNQNTGFSIRFTVDDPDPEDTLTIEAKLNGEVLRTIQNAKRRQEYDIAIPDEKVFAVALGELNTVQIKVSDNQGAETYRYKYFKRSNTAPTLSKTDLQDLGEITTPPTFEVTATDLEGDAMTYSLFIEEEAVIVDKDVPKGGKISETLSKKAFAKIKNASPTKARLVVKDVQKASAVVNFTFTRKLEKCYYIFKKETDAKATSLYLDVNRDIAKGAIFKVYGCNNALDASPTWEEMTGKVEAGLAHTFTNATKTHASWAVGAKVEILPGTSEAPSWIMGIGGGYK